VSKHTRIRVGIDEALARLEERLGRAQAGDPVISLDEVLYHIYALDQYHKSLGAEAYKEAEGKSAGGHAAAGLLYARHRVTHGQVAEVASLVRVLAQPVSARRPALVGFRQELRWAPFDALPEPQPGHEHEREAGYYRASVQQRRVLEPIRDALGSSTSSARALRCERQMPS
jgi:hypothetical protein